MELGAYEWFVSGVLLANVVLLVTVLIHAFGMERRLTDRIGAVEVTVGRLEEGQSTLKEGQRNLAQQVDGIGLRRIERLEDRLFEGRHTQPEGSRKPADPEPAYATT